MKIDFKLAKSFLKDNGFTYSDISKMIGCSKPFIWQLLNGKRRLTYEMAIQISSIFNITPDEMFYGAYKENEDFNKKIIYVLEERNKIIKLKYKKCILLKDIAK